MTRTHEMAVDAQFGPQAAEYVRSAVHASGPDLDALEYLARFVAPSAALDLGTGGGHAAYRIAPLVGHVTAVDLSPAMLAAVRTTARSRGLSNIETVEASAQTLPFATGQFDFLCCRYCAHHWQDFEAALREARRVLRPGSRAAFIDGYSPGPAQLDTHLQAVELLRDTSHVRDHSLAEWHAALTRSGFAPMTLRSWRIRMEFASWIARMRTPAGNVQAIRALQAAATSRVREHFVIEADGSFLLDVVLIDAVAC